MRIEKFEDIEAWKKSKGINGKNIQNNDHGAIWQRLWPKRSDSESFNFDYGQHSRGRFFRILEIIYWFP